MERLDYFLAKIDVGFCWNWTAVRSPDGYGRFWNGTTMVLAHRWIYEHLTQTVLGELTIDHVCRNTLCQNPDHMEPVTDGVNRARGGARFASLIRQQNRTHCKRGHEFTPENTYWRGGPNRNQRGCVTCRITHNRNAYVKRRALGYYDKVAA